MTRSANWLACCELAGLQIHLAESHDEIRVAARQTDGLLHMFHGLWARAATPQGLGIPGLHPLVVRADFHRFREEFFRPLPVPRIDRVHPALCDLSSEHHFVRLPATRETGTSQDARQQQAPEHDATTNEQATGRSRAHGFAGPGNVVHGRSHSSHGRTTRSHSGRWVILASAAERTVSNGPPQSRTIPLP